MCQHFKILVRAHADVGRVVPLVGQAARDGHAPLQDGQPVGPVRKVGKGHHAGAAHTGSFAQHHFGVAQVLQRVDLQHHVKTVVAKHGQAFVQVELDHIDSALHAGQHVGVVNLHAIAGAAALALQVRQHGPVAAAQVQHARDLGHQARQGFHGGLFAHANSFAMLSK